MKTRAFLFIAAISYVILLSCGNDHEPEIARDCAKLNVVVEELQYENSTRAAYQPTDNKLYWQNGDAINVYDEILMTYDEYTFNPAKSVFSTSETQSAIDGAISYALFPMDLVDYSGWTTQGCRAVISLPSTLVYDGSHEDVATVNGSTLYRAQLPMWGTATGTFGNVTVNLKYLCSVMKLKVIKGKASFVKISSASKPISGGVEAVIAKNGLTEPEPIIKKGKSSLGPKKYLIIDLRKMSSAEGYVYVPIIPDTYDDLTVSTTSLDVPAGTELTDEQIADPEETIWKVAKVYPTGKQMKRNIVYVLNL